MLKKESNASKSRWKYLGMLILGIIVVISSFGKVILAEDTNPVANETSERKITITKYQTSALNDQGNPGTGVNVTVDKKVVQGVEFSVQKVEPKGVQLTDPTVQKLGTDYSLIGETKKGVTDQNGQIVFDLGKGTSVDGIYLVTETDTTGAKDPTTGKAITVVTPANPFFVYVPQTFRGTQSGLIYDVQVQPKNVVENDLEPVKTIEGKPGASVIAGENFEWELTTKVPTGLYPIATKDIEVPIVDQAGNQLYNVDKSPAYSSFKQGEPIYVNGGSYYNEKGEVTESATVSRYSITDTLDDRLTYVSATVWVHNTAGWSQLADADYVVKNENNQFTMELTEKGIKEIGSEVATDSEGKEVTGPFDQISTHIITDVEAGFNGNIPNTFNVTYQTPGGKPVTQEPPTKPQYYTGGFDILKQDEETQAKLAGAEFKIAISESDAQSGKFLATDGASYLSADLPNGVDFLTAVSNNEGKASFNGLPLDWTSGDGSNVVNIGADGLPTNGDTIEKTYYVVETKAPEGYELLKAPQEVLVTLGSKDTTKLTVNDKKATNLPFTGGTGTVLVISIALSALALGTVLMVMNKKRQEN